MENNANIATTHFQPKYPPLNAAYPGLVCVTPRGNPSIPEVWAIPDFLTHSECDQLINASSDCLVPSPVVGSVMVSSGEVVREEAKSVVASSRTSVSCYLHRDDVPTILSKVTRVLNPEFVLNHNNGPADGRGDSISSSSMVASSSATESFPPQPPPIPIDSRNCELLQVTRYQAGQFYAAHYDAFDVSTIAGQGFVSNGGQRTHTILIYLNDVPAVLGGGTTFKSGRLVPELLPDDMSVPMQVYPPFLMGGSVILGVGGVGLTLQPKKGMAVIFFPSHNVYDELTGEKVGVKLDNLGLHEARPVLEGGIKYVSQIWVRSGKTYSGRESKRLETKI
jgi:prolyl 4-hydroxylase